jgi:hypothetical protein
VSIAIEFACEDADGLLAQYSEIPLSRVQGGSDLLARLLFVEELYDYYEGEWPHVFECIEEKFALEDPLFGPLTEESPLTTEAENAIAYLESLLRLLERHSGEIPPVYSFTDDKTGETFTERALGPLRAEGAFDHCALVDEDEDEAVDLRGETLLEASGHTLRIVREPIIEHAGPDLSRMLEVARTARTYGRRFVLQVS